MSSQPTNAESQINMADCTALLNLECIRSLAERYEENLKKRDVDIGFNLFELISDHYYRETFHSDILNALLDPKGKHQAKNKYLDLFLKYIKSLVAKSDAKINLSDYSEAEVVKEEGRIDILIKGRKHAIIIENKINGAGDREKQLPRYLEKVKGDGFACDAIIYLRLNENLGPAETGWTDDEKEKVKTRLIKISAYDGSEKDLLNGWILKCQKESDYLDAHAILRQYGKIIEKLGGNIMNEPNMKEFYNVMVKDDGKNLKTALSLEKMLADLISYRVRMIRERFDNDRAPFERLGPYGKNPCAAFSGCKDFNLGLSIWVNSDSYIIYFLDYDDRPGGNGKAKALLEKTGYYKEYYTSPNEAGVFCKEFKFPSEEVDFFQHITNLKNKLAKQLYVNIAEPTSPASPA
jgi:hypothetical protein